MRTKQQIIDTLSKEGQFIDNFILDTFIKTWKIDPIYEDENGVEYFDEVSFNRIKDLIIQKDKIDKTEEKSLSIDSESILETKENNVQEDNIDNDKDTNLHIENSKNCNIQLQSKDKQQDNLNIVETNDSDIEVNSSKNEVAKINFDFNNKNLDILTSNIAKKVSLEIENFFKNDPFLEKFADFSSFKADNKVLATKIKSIIEQNNELKLQIKSLESKLNEYVKVFGNIYVKK